jgi:hypothetical protein
MGDNGATTGRGEPGATRAREGRVTRCDSGRGRTTPGGRSPSGPAPSGSPRNRSPALMLAPLAPCRHRGPRGPAPGFQGPRGRARRRHRSYSSGGARRRARRPIAGSSRSSPSSPSSPASPASPPSSRRGPWCAESGLTKAIRAGRFTLGKGPCRAAAGISAMGPGRVKIGLQARTQIYDGAFCAELLIWRKRPPGHPTGTQRLPVGADLVAQTLGSRPHRLQQSAYAGDRHHALHIVGEHV